MTEDLMEDEHSPENNEYLNPVSSQTPGSPSCFPYGPYGLGKKVTKIEKSHSSLLTLD